MVARPPVRAYFALWLLAGTQAFAGGVNAVHKLDTREDGATTVVTIRGTATPTFTVYKLERPERVVIDVANARVGGDVDGPVAVNTWAVSQLAVQALGGQEAQVVRVLVGFARPSTYRVKAVGNDVVVTVVARDPNPGVALDKRLADAEKKDADADRRLQQAEAMRAEAERLKKEAEAGAAAAQKRRAEAETAAAAADRQRQEAEAAVGAVEKRRLEAETARQTAEKRRADADAALTAAEKRRGEAERAAKEADARARAAEAAGAEDAARKRREAEAMAAQADKQRREAEAAAAQAETRRREAEQKRADADERRKAAEALVERAESRRREAEDARTLADNERKRAEDAKLLAQRERTRAEDAKTQAVDERKRAEDAKTAAERERRAAEEARDGALKEREVAEKARGDAEAARRREEQRVAAVEKTRREEEQRIDALGKARTAAEGAAARANQALAQAEKRREEAQAAVAALESARQQAEAARKDAEARRHKAEEAARAADALARDTRATEADIVRARADAGRLEKERQAAEAELQRRKRELADGEQKARALAEARTRAQTEVAATRDKVDATRRALADEEKRRAELGAARAAEEKALAEATRRREDEEKKAAAAEGRRREAEGAAKRAAADAAAAATLAQSAAAQKTAAEAAAQKAEQQATAHVTAAEAAARRATAEKTAAEAAARQAAADAMARKEAAEKAASEAAARQAAAEAAARKAAAQAAAQTAAAKSAAEALAKQASADAKAQRNAAEAAAKKAMAEAAAQKVAAEMAAAEAVTQKAAAEKAARAAADATAKVEAAAKAPLTPPEGPPARTPTPTPTRTPTATAAATIRDVDYIDLPATARVVVKLTGDAEPRLVSATERQAVFELAGVDLPERLERALDVRDYQGPVTTIKSFRDPADPRKARLVIELAGVPGPAAPSLRRTADAVTIDFAKPMAKARPPAQIAPPIVGGYSVATTPVTAQTVGQQRAVIRARRIGLDVKDADIHNLMRLIAQAGNVDIIVPDDVRATVTVRLTNVPWKEAMEVILQSKQLWYRQQGNIIRVANRKDLDAEDQAERERLRAQIQEERPETEVFTLNYAKATEARTQVTPLLSPRGKIAIDDRTNAVVVTDVAGNRSTIIALLRRLDTQTPQIQIEARVVEARSTWRRQLGIQWGFNAIASAQTGNPTGLVFPSTIGVAGGNDDPNAPTGGLFTTNPNFAVNLPAATGLGSGGSVGFTFGSLGGTFNLNLRLSALEDTGTIRIISAPKITVLNGREATIRQGVSIPIQVVSAAGTMTQFVPADLELRAKPYVSQRDCSIVLEVSIDKNEADFANRGARGDPSLLRKEARTTMLIADGDTSVIGGIYTRNTGLTTNKVPWLADIPILGFFFKNRIENDERTEVLIFLTPRITNKASLMCETANDRR